MSTDLTSNLARYTGVITPWIEPGLGWRTQQFKRFLPKLDDCNKKLHDWSTSKHRCKRP